MSKQCQDGQGRPDTGGWAIFGFADADGLASTRLDDWVTWKPLESKAYSSRQGVHEPRDQGMKQNG